MLQPEATAANPAVAGVGEGGVRRAEQLAAVAGLVAVEHLRADCHADLSVSGVDGIDVHPHRLSAGILLKHLFGAALSQRARRIGVHRSALGKEAGKRSGAAAASGDSALRRNSVAGFPASPECGASRARRPSQRAARIVDAAQHRQIGIFGAGDAFVHHVERFVGQHGGAHRQQAGVIRQRNDLLAEGLQQANRFGIVLRIVLRRAADGDGGGVRIVGTEIEQHHGRFTFVGQLAGGFTMVNISVTSSIVTCGLVWRVV